MIVPFIALGIVVVFVVLVTAGAIGPFWWLVVAVGVVVWLLMLAKELRATRRARARRP